MLVSIIILGIVCFILAYYLIMLKEKHDNLLERFENFEKDIKQLIDYSKHKQKLNADSNFELRKEITNMVKERDYKISQIEKNYLYFEKQIIGWNDKNNDLQKEIQYLDSQLGKIDKYQNIQFDMLKNNIKENNIDIENLTNNLNNFNDYLEFKENIKYEISLLQSKINVLNSANILLKEIQNYKEKAPARADYDVNNLTKELLDNNLIEYGKEYKFGKLALIIRNYYLIPYGTAKNRVYAATKLGYFINDNGKYKLNRNYINGEWV